MKSFLSQMFIVGVLILTFLVSFSFLGGPKDNGDPLPQMYQLKSNWKTGPSVEQVIVLMGSNIDQTIER